MISPHTILYCTVVLECNQSFSDYKCIAEWLSLYNYVLPAHRTIHPHIGIALAQWYDGNLFAAYRTYTMLDAIHTHKEQQEIIQWISDYNLSHTVPCSHSMLVLESTNSIG
jgi:hypothetical protein